MKITQIESAKKRVGRFNVFVDEEFALACSEADLIRLGLAVGDQLTAARLEKLLAEVTTTNLYERAVRFLAYRPRSTQELRRYLTTKRRQRKPSTRQSFPRQSFKSSVSGPLIEPVFEKLRRQGYVDDVKFASWWVKQRTTGRNPRGVRLIRQELTLKGISREQIDLVLADLSGAATEEDLAKRAGERALSRYRKLSSDQRKKKLTDYLARRGFSWSAIRAAIDALGEKG